MGEREPRLRIDPLRDDIVVLKERFEGDKHEPADPGVAVGGVDQSEADGIKTADAGLAAAAASLGENEPPHHKPSHEVGRFADYGRRAVTVRLVQPVAEVSVRRERKAHEGLSSQPSQKTLVALQVVLLFVRSQRPSQSNLGIGSPPRGQQRGPTKPKLKQTMSAVVAGIR